NAPTRRQWCRAERRTSVQLVRGSTYGPRRGYLRDMVGDARRAGVACVSVRPRSNAGSGANERDLMLGVAHGLGVAIVPFSLGDVSEAGALVIRRRLEPLLAMPDTVV